MILRRYFGSMAGYLFLFLLIGVVGSASLAFGLADARRRSDLQLVNLQRVADRVQDFISLVNGAPKPVREQMLARGIPGLHAPFGTEKIQTIDPALTRLLAAQIGAPSRAERAVPSTCVPQPSSGSFYDQINCWVISIQLADHAPVKLVAFSPRPDSFDLPRPDPVFLSILTGAVGVLAFFASLMAAAPLDRLARAARSLGRDLDSEPLSERGPFEVRDSIRAFNAMQAKLREHVVERTRILASITHDLQTPLTRLRLRLEKVDDVALRSRLIDDLAGMQILIRQGLDLCRGNQTEEPFVAVALDSLLESVVEDAAEGGGEVTLAQRPGCDVEVQPNALQRCLANLLSNALNYGRAAQVSATMADGEVRIRIRDFGPGIPADKLEAVFEPFVRLDTAVSRAAAVAGLGLGLTIAKTLAQKNDADLSLSNHPDGGLEACLVLRRGLVANANHNEPVSAPGVELETLDT